MIFKSALITQASGSIGGVTFFQSRSGLTMRARAVPVDPNSPFQTPVRAAVSLLSNRWGDTLADVDRQNWENYADNVTLLNALGDAITVSGFNMFIRSNVQRVVSDLGLIDAAPTTFNLGNQPGPGAPTVSAGTGIATFTWPGADPGWMGTDNEFGMFYISRPMSPGRKFFRGPYRLAAALAGDQAIPLTSPQEVSVPFTVALGQKLGIRHNILRVDARRSASIEYLVTVVA